MLLSTDDVVDEDEDANRLLHSAADVDASDGSRPINDVVPRT